MLLSDQGIFARVDRFMPSNPAARKDARHVRAHAFGITGRPPLVIVTPPEDQVPTNVPA